jgi:hypothetical protein
MTDQGHLSPILQTLLPSFFHNKPLEQALESYVAMVELI